MERLFSTICDDILEGMKQSQEAMKKQGVWRDDITFEEWAKWAGSNCKITESK